MRNVTRSITIALVICVATPVAAFAADAVAVISSLKLDKVITVNGQLHHELVTPNTVVPGNQLLFVYDYKNNGDKPATNFVLANKVPATVSLEGAQADNFEISVDGGKTWGKLAQTTVVKPGATVRAAQYADVTNVRWVIPVIAPGASGTLQYHAVVR